MCRGFASFNLFNPFNSFNWSPQHPISNPLRVLVAVVHFLMDESELQSLAETLVSEGKGILAADESTPTITRRFEAVGISSTAENRRAYREMLFTTPRLGEFISGVILFDETIRQTAKDRTPLPEILRRQGIIPGIKVDKGTTDLANCPGEKITEGLDGLRERLAEYAELGARFTKWRAVIHIGESMPTRACLYANAHVLARFAALSQEAGLLPIVEPEVLMDGNHSIKRCERVTEATLKAVFQQLSEQRVSFECMLLKCNMATPGKDFSPPATGEEVAEATLRCLKRSVPPAVPGIVFLSGGQSETVATQNLNALNQHANAAWQRSFSFGRALQNSALEAWSKRHLQEAQQLLLHRARCNSAARNGQYSLEMEDQAMAA